MLKRSPSNEFKALMEEDKRLAQSKQKKIRFNKEGGKRKANISLGYRTFVAKKPTLLGPILKSRFEGASSSSTS